MGLTRWAATLVAAALVGSASTVLAAAPVRAATPPASGGIVARGINQPSVVAQGPDGNVWFTDGAGSAFGSITPAGQVTITDFTPTVFGIAGLTLGPDGLLWFTSPLSDTVGKITPTGVVRYRGTGAHRPTAIVAGPDGNLWFTGSEGSIGRVTPNGTITTSTAAASAPRGASPPAPTATCGSPTRRATRSVGSPRRG